MSDVRLKVEEGLRGRLRLGLVSGSPVEVGPSSAALIEETEQTCVALRSELAGMQPSEIERLRRTITQRLQKRSKDAEDFGFSAD